MRYSTVSIWLYCIQWEKGWEYKFEIEHASVTEPSRLLPNTYFCSLENFGKTGKSIHIDTQFSTLKKSSFILWSQCVDDNCETLFVHAFLLSYIYFQPHLEQEGVIICLWWNEGSMLCSRREWHKLFLLSSAHGYSAPKCGDILCNPAYYFMLVLLPPRELSMTPWT